MRKHVSQERPPPLDECQTLGRLRGYGLTPITASRTLRIQPGSAVLKVSSRAGLFISLFVTASRSRPVLFTSSHTWGSSGPLLRFQLLQGAAAGRHTNPNPTPPPLKSRRNSLHLVQSFCAITSCHCQKPAFGAGRGTDRASTRLSPRMVLEPFQGPLVR